MTMPIRLLRATRSSSRVRRLRTPCAYARTTPATTWTATTSAARARYCSDAAFGGLHRVAARNARTHASQTDAIRLPASDQSDKGGWTRGVSVVLTGRDPWRSSSFYLGARMSSTIGRCPGPSSGRVKVALVVVVWSTALSAAFVPGSVRTRIRSASDASSNCAEALDQDRIARGGS